MSFLEPDDPRILYVPFAEAAKPPGGLIEHFKDRYWACHPERGVMFYKPDRRHSGAPQCNSSEAICLDTNNKLYPWASIRFMPSVFRRIDLRDYEL